MGKTIEVKAQNIKIVDMGDQGYGIGKDEAGKVYLVENAVPGETMDIEVRKHRSRLGIGRATQRTIESPWRTQPFCSHFGVCGGCKWQHMTYEGQLHYKEKNVLDALTRIGGIPQPVVRPICGASENRYYRNKLEYSFGNSRWLEQAEIDNGQPADRDALGFHRPGSFEKIVDIRHCYLQPEPSNAIRNHVREIAKDRRYSFYDVKQHTGFLRNLLVRTSSMDQCMVILVIGEDRPEDLEHICTAILQAFPALTTLYTLLNQKKNDSIYDLTPVLVHGPGFILESLGDLQYRIGPKSFFQTNTRQALQLYQFVEEFAQLRGDEVVYDLYSGTGTIGLFLSRKCKKVVGVEEIPEAVADARLNASFNQIPNVNFYTGDVKLMLQNGLFQQEGKPDCVVIDPPRAGLHPDIIPVLNNNPVDKIIYVSCNPATQARDLKLLGTVYDHIVSQPVDMFPHTGHIENVTLLQPKPKN
jgi:23S rRNA (uracil1939-C5)-methyltransferase